MSGFVSWIMSILAIVVAGSVLDMFLSEKKLGKMVRGVFASLLVLVIISPLPNLFKGCDGMKDGFVVSEVTLDQAYLNYAKLQKSAALEKGLAAALEDVGYRGVSVAISAEFSQKIEIKQVRLNISNLVIDKQSLNINKVESIKKLTADYLNIETAIIVVIE